jgi:peptidoglycan hydrolase-like protein with peptidoglycan-binding domain
MNGLFDFLGKASTGVAKTAGTVLNPLQSAAQSVIQVKQALDQSKLAWKGIPYTVNEQGFAIPTQPGSTGERFVPGTSTISTGAGITSATNDTLSKAELLQLQTALKNKGYDPGPLDGLYGPKTQAGIKAFQSANSLPVTGAATFDLLARLTAVAKNPTQIPNNPSRRS